MPRDNDDKLYRWSIKSDTSLSLSALVEKRLVNYSLTRDIVSTAQVRIRETNVMTAGLRMSVFLLALAQAAVIPIFFRDGFAAASAGPDAPTGPIPLEPAGYAFIIWGFIYLGSIIYAIYQLRPKAPARATLDQIAPLTLLAFAASTAWTVFAARGPLWATAPLIVTMAACLVWALAVAVRGARQKAWGFKISVLAPIGLYGGWVSVASFVNVTDVLRSYSIVPALADTASLIYPAIAVVAVFAGWMLVAVTRGATAYAAAVAWALAGVAVANLTRDLSIPVAVIAAGGASTVIVVWAAALRRRASP